MKKIFLGICFITFSQLAIAQFGGILDKAKKKVEEKKKKEESKVETVTGTGDGGKTVEETKKETSGNEEAPTGTKTYSKYDFVPGEKIIVFEDFMQDAVGDFPDKWNTNASAEVVTLDGQQGHWLKFTKHGVFMPEFIESFPENFTFEFDLMCDNLVESWGLQTVIAQLEERNRPENWSIAANRFTYTILPGNAGNGQFSYVTRKDGTGETSNSSGIKTFKGKSKPVHVAFWRQKERIRVYLDQEKVSDLPKAMSMAAKFNAIVFNIQLTDGKSHFLMTNLRLGVGAPDTRNKFLTEGKWVTHGILFDVNSDKIKPESYGTAKEIATILKDNANVKVKIVGHTDTDGNDASNLDLSKRRAASVKAYLAKEFSIDESRMVTDGMGESKPIDKNDTPAGKANNRRVEFIKL